MDNIKFGEYISVLRKEKGFTQKELAKKLYVSDKAISKWETGKSIPDLPTLSSLAEVLGVDLLDLLQVNDETKNMVSENIIKIYKDTNKKNKMRYAAISIVLIILITVSLVFVITRQKPPKITTLPIKNPIISADYETYDSFQAVSLQNDDLLNNKPTDVYAVADGHIYATGYGDFIGYRIVIKDSTHLYVYSFLDNIDNIEIGQKVKEGDYLVTRNPIEVGISTGAFVKIAVFEINVIDPNKVIELKDLNRR